MAIRSGEPISSRPPRQWLLWLAGLLFLATVLIDWEMTQGLGSSTRWLFLPGVVTAVLTLFFVYFHRHLLLVAAVIVSLVAGVVCLLFGVPEAGITEYASLLLGLFLAAREQSTRQFVLTGLLLILALLLRSLPAQPPFTSMYLVTVAGLVALAGRYLRTLALQAEKQRVATRRAERLHLARELHDVAAYELTGVIVQIQALRHISERSPGDVSGALHDIERSAVATLDALRDMVGTLRTPSGPVPPSVQDICSKARQLGLPVELSWAIEPELSDRELGLVSSIVREGVTNALRYATNASRVVVAVTRSQDYLVVTVEDDARTIEGARPFPGSSGRGLKGLEKRLEEKGGSLQAGALEQGWLLEACFPRVDGDA